MGTYIVLVNSTDKGAVNVREVPNRQQTSRDTAAKLGIVRKTVYMTLGPYDFVQIIEAPNEEAVAKYVLSINSKGNVRTTTMRAWDEAEHFEFIKACRRPKQKWPGLRPGHLHSSPPRNQVCWIADSIQAPPLARRKVQNSVTSDGSSSTTRPLARSTILSFSE